MNPSSSGWIDKFGHIIKEKKVSYASFPDLYNDLKETGFVYGINVGIPKFVTVELNLTEDEKAKINLLSALYFTYNLKYPNAKFSEFVEHVFKFYGVLNIGSVPFFKRILQDKKTSAQLETLIDSRIYLDDNVISKTFNSIITNSLLIVDILVYKRYLDTTKDIKDYAEKVEHIAINLAYHTLNSKEINKNDERLAQLFASSLTFVDAEQHPFDDSYKDELIGHFTAVENPYFMDIACLAVWEDQTLEYKESKFIFSLGNEMGLTEKEIQKHLEDVSIFFELNKEFMPHLKEHNFASQFYDSMSKIVKKLILRNSKRLGRELSESKELVALLSKSTMKDLTPEEKKKVQDQLLDIFKSIPSLAIFILPGGAVLLPIFIKLIPKLLPSAFDENRVD